ncbi:hypothetical protein QW131_14160 [Roseibium salinum]|nr:hypothetical protein [Roseibium salinum]
MEQGGGQSLWDELYAPFGLKPVMAGNTGVQMGGWFRKEVNSLADLKGLKIRMPGLGGEVMRRLGATPVGLPPGELFQALQSGVLDATEFLGPWSDRAMGFHKVAKSYYTPGFHEPNGTGEAIFNRVALDGLPEELRIIVLEACRAEKRPVAGGKQLGERRQPEAAPGRGRRHHQELSGRRSERLAGKTRRSCWGELAEKNSISMRIYESNTAARERLAPWSEIAMRRFMEARDGRG